MLNGPNARILVVAAHADDEVLGAGGTLYMAIQSGASIHVLILSTDSSSRDIDDAKRTEMKERRISASKSVAATMKWELSLFDYPDNAFDTVCTLDINKAIEKVIKSYQPTVIITHSPHDLSRDHQIVSSSVITASRPYGDGSHAPTILYCEIASSTNWNFGIPENSFRPNLWVALDQQSLQSKLDSMKKYSDELRAWPHPRSIEGVTIQAKFRGSEVGVELSEVFVIARHISSVLVK